MDDYCHLTKKLQDGLTFEMVYQEKVLLISIKPSVDEFGQDVILENGNGLDGSIPAKSQSKAKQKRRK